MLALGNRNADHAQQSGVHGFRGNGSTRVEVEAESLYDAVGIGIAGFDDARGAMLCGSPRSRFTVEVRQPTTEHAVEYGGVRGVDE